MCKVPVYGLFGVAAIDKLSTPQKDLRLHCGQWVCSNSEIQEKKNKHLLRSQLLNQYHSNRTVSTESSRPAMLRKWVSYEVSGYSGIKIQAEDETTGFETILLLANGVVSLGLLFPITKPQNGVSNSITSLGSGKYS